MPDRINVSDFNLTATLDCGQAFRWHQQPDGWFVGVVGREIWRLRQTGEVLEYDCRREPARGRNDQPTRPRAGSRLQDYLALDVSLPEIVATFSDDPALHEAVRAHWGLRVLRQEPWETLASFIASSTKQIVQIRQIVENLARCFGEPLDNDQFAFPNVEKIAAATHDELWNCKLGFRAKYLHAAARRIAAGEIDLAALPRWEYERALEELLKLDGVGEKIANCTLLFSCGFAAAFPIDVWMERALRRLAFHGHKVAREKVRAHFGPYGGWAQQYLFFAERSRRRQPLLDAGAQR